ncbi:gluconokinase (plasmid) [Azospirillum sp. B510]|uniref:gluconokinase n=1 Tax=Azospirillum sp. (strain B510) TaxID=137722 RepID=UPI0001C4C9A6|nr:gluconokinase [Azospirillum sp. B510]BAI74688.1 gluconokinase [Azospirillum sp. B510]
MIVVVMGVAGCGKTTVGQMLAARLGCGFSDADSFHPPANVEKMRAGIALGDDDRWPWLAALRRAMDGWLAEGASHVVACSALRQVYREILSPAGEPKGTVVFVHLTGSPELIGRRLRARQGHYMNPALLESQFATLEAPEDAIVADVGRSPAEIVEDVLHRLP